MQSCQASDQILPLVNSFIADNGYPDDSEDENDEDEDYNFDFTGESGETDENGNLCFIH